MACGIQCSVGLPHSATVGMGCVIVVFPYHTHLIFEPVHEVLTLIAFEIAKSETSTNERILMYQLTLRSLFCLF